MNVLLLGVALSAPACAVRSAQPARVVHIYTFPLSLPADTLVCAQTARPTPATGCITLKRLRDLTRDLEAD